MDRDADSASLGLRTVAYEGGNDRAFCWLARQFYVGNRRRAVGFRRLGGGRLELLRSVYDCLVVCAQSLAAQLGLSDVEPQLCLGLRRRRLVATYWGKRVIRENVGHLPRRGRRRFDQPEIIQQT